MKNIFFYPAIFQNEDIGYSAIIPDIPGCMTQGDSLGETLDMIQEAIGLMLEETEPSDYPAPSLPENIQTEKGQFVMMVSFNKLEYDKKYHSRSITKTLSIPEWLNTAALKRNINFSNVLQNALIRELNIENNLS
ncbi:type II toxin-antitoxin system HicB family antitoxin [Anaerovibrio slackiae]|uniref:type II toxin-antitoxin system HicB family antitoxin n=1 Tax=Anaerovibrio slackiae TaxID=2652309 RepID=UPI00386C6B32